MRLIRYYVRASADPAVIQAAAAKLRADWDPLAEFEAPDGSRTAESHVAAILGILSGGANTAAVKGYLRRAEEAALGAARSTAQMRGDLADAFWRLMADAAIRASNADTDGAAT